MLKNNTNPKVSLKEYMVSFNISINTAMKLRRCDKKYLKIPLSRPLLYSDFFKIYACYPLETPE